MKTASDKMSSKTATVHPVLISVTLPFVLVYLQLYIFCNIANMHTCVVLYIYNV